MECDSDSEFEEAFDEVVGEIVVTSSEEVRTILNQHRVWVKDWGGRRGFVTFIFKMLQGFPWSIIHFVS